MENFFGGVTTAHGINQVFKEHNGPVRQIFWFCAFLACFYFLFFFIIDVITSFFFAATASVVSVSTYSGAVPMATLCNLNPLRCGCSAFYNPAVLNSEVAFAAALPFVCSQLVSFLPSAWETLAADGTVLASVLLEDAGRYVDLNATRANMAAFNSTIDCGGGTVTDAAVVAQLLAGKASFQSLYSYAGYADRNAFVRGCMATDTQAGSPTLGQRVSCMGDQWWGPPAIDPDHGACHTFNPCHGFPVGAQCVADADCAHNADPRRTGGSCSAGRCACSRCVAGAGCQLAQQVGAGRGRGIRLVGNVEANQVPSNPPTHLPEISEISEISEI